MCAAVPELSIHLPSSLRERTRCVDLAGVPALVVHPAFDASSPSAALPEVPWLLWMHGRTASKEIDPGRALRLIRAGIGSVLLDLPGHGARTDALLQLERNAFRVVEAMVSEIDEVVASVAALGGFDQSRIAIGGMSAGGMAALGRLLTSHPFCACSLECTSGDLDSLRGREIFDASRAARLNPITQLSAWRSISVQVLHNVGDALVPIEAQRRFVAALRERTTPAELVEMHEFTNTGAPSEHAGFGKFGAEAKDLQTAFLVRAFGMH